MYRTENPSVCGPHMIDTPINPRADVSPTCRGSTGTKHNGWNPSPRFLSSSRKAGRPQETTTDGPRDGWQPQPQPGSAGVFHAPHRIRERIGSARPWRGLCDRHPGRLGRATDPILARSGFSNGWIRTGLGGLLPRVGRVLTAPSPTGPRGRGWGRGFGPGSAGGSRAHVGPRPEGWLAAGDRSVADAPRVGALVAAGMVLVDRRGGRSAERDAHGRDSGRVAGGHPAPTGGGPNGVCPVHSRVDGLVDVPGRSAALFGSFRGVRPPLFTHSAFDRTLVASPVGGIRS